MPVRGKPEMSEKNAGSDGDRRELIWELVIFTTADAITRRCPIVVDVDLCNLDSAVIFRCQRIDRRTDDLTRTTPVRPEVN